MTLSRRIATAVAASTLIAPAIGCGPADAVVTQDVRITFSSNPAGSVITAVTNTGTAATTQSVITSYGGQIVSRTSAPTSSQAADFPDYNGTATGPRAIIAIVNSGATDQLTPGAAAFTMGADARLDAVNDGTYYDDGNNIIQRGLYTDAAQYKLQIDGNRFSCRVKGDLGAIEKWSPLVLTADQWYHATCSRQIVTGGERIVLRVWPINADGTVGTKVETTSPVGLIGNLSFDSTTALSIGGKLTPKLKIAGDPDPYNGRLDNLILDIS